MRPRSLIGPLLLIAVGVLLLMNTLRPELPILEAFTRYWPLLLIGWGLLRLAEILVWRLRGLPLPARGLSGGEWTAVVFICLIGSGLHAANRHRLWERLGVFTGKRVELVVGRPYDFPIPEQRQPASKAPRIFLENLRGNARITGAETLEVRVSGRKTIRALLESDASAADRKSPLEISQTGDQIVIRTNLDRVTGDYQVRSHLEITVPRGATLEARGREGDFDVSGLEGGLEITSDRAEVRAANIGGSVRLNLRRSGLIRVADAKGPVEVIGGRGRDLEIENVQEAVSVEGFYSGDLRFVNLGRPLRFQNVQTTLRVEKVAGQIQMDLGRVSGSRLEGPVRLSSSRSRDVELDGFANEAEISMDGGDIRLRPAQPRLGIIQARTRSGDIELALPEGAIFQLRARTARGDVLNEFGPALKQESEGRHGALLSGGSGEGPVLTLDTARGTITVRKDTGAALAPFKGERRAQIEVERDQDRIRVQRH